MRYNVTAWGERDDFGPAWTDTRVLNQEQLDSCKEAFEAIFAARGVLKSEGTDGSCLYETPDGKNGFEAIPIEE